MNGLVFIGLLVSAAVTFLTGMGLENPVERNGGYAGAVLGSGEGGAGKHGAFAGLIALFLLLHLVVNRQSIAYTLKNMFKSK